MTVREIFSLVLGVGSPYKPPVPEPEGESLPAAPPLPAPADVEALAERARKGDRDAQRNLGIMHYRGRGVPLDRAEAFKWLTFAMRQGDDQAEKFLEMIGPTLAYDEAYEGRRRISEVTGEPVPPREVESPDRDEFSQGAEGETQRPWDAPGSYAPALALAESALSTDAASAPERAAEVGEIPPPQVMLEPVPVGGRGWLWAAAACVLVAGVAAGAYWLVVRNAGMSMKPVVATQSAGGSQPGSATTPFKAEDVAKLRVAAGAGVADSQFQLGLACERGEGVAQDFAAAAAWYRKAAEQGDGRAQNNLGVLYINGKGVPVDYVEAYKWIYLAAKRSIRGAAYNRDQLTALFLKGDQVAAALKDAAALEARLESKP